MYFPARRKTAFGAIPRCFLLWSFEEAGTAQAFLAEHYFLFVLDQVVHVKNHAFINVNPCFRSRRRDLWWRPQREFRLQHRFAIMLFHFYFLSVGAFFLYFVLVCMWSLSCSVDSRIYITCMGKWSHWYLTLSHLYRSRWDDLWWCGGRWGGWL